MKTMITGLLGPLLLTGCAGLGTGGPLPWDDRVLRGELDNGLEYRVVEDHSEAGRLDLRLTVRAGSVDETDEQVGVAHLLEHLAFYSRGGEGVTVRQRMEALGWQQARHYNAVTSYDRTQYLLSPAKGAAELEPALQALSTLVFAGDYRAEDLEHERPVVVEEWRGGLGSAQRMNDQRTASQRVGSRYPAHRTIGNEAAIRAAPVDALRAFQQRWYQPGNMVLSIVGDADPQRVAAAIEQALGRVPGQAVPDRSHRELPLDGHLKIFHLQDSQSGSNQVSLLLRLHEPASRAEGPDGLRERLVDRLALSAFLAQLRRQPLQPGVRSLSVQKTQIGRYSSVLGIAAGVDGNGHEAALRQVLTELERARRFGLGAADLDAQKASLRALAQGMLERPDVRDFQGWVNELNDAAVLERPVHRKHAVARAYLAALDGVGLDAVNQRLRTWLDSPDQVLQLSAPGLTPLRLPTVAEVQRLRAALAGQPLERPQFWQPERQALAALPEVPAPGAPGTIVERQRFPAEHVEHWRLGNGDRLVWLRKPGALGGLDFKAESSAGYLAEGLRPWRAQMAVQLAAQSGPPGWSADAVRRWRGEQRVSLALDQQAQRLQLDLGHLPTPSGAPERAPDVAAVLRVYRLSQQANIDPLAFDEARVDLLQRIQRRRDSVRERQDDLLRQLSHGDGDGVLPGEDELVGLSRDALQADWQRLARAPVTYYLMADVPPEQLEGWVRSELAGIPRGQPLPSMASQQRPGRRQGELAIALEPRASLRVLAYREHPWSPEDAARVAALRELARQSLKQALRGEAGGIYSLNYEAELNPDNQRIESRLSFASDPARLDELRELAQRTLAGLPARIDEQALAPLRRELVRQERLRLDDAQTQMRRLVLSERKWGDPRYLGRQASVADALQVAPLRRLAGALADTRNQVQVLLLPVPAEAAR
ncbi:insulinase family protein [Metapseudomonas otitidis]|uniref:M16 family metallopeptidase n=1 Tax=Metapseudomonas otitidis TaxID=319939 RepID=UPI003A838DA3